MSTTDRVRVLKDLEPQKVFSYFEMITSIPHGSKNEKQLSDYIYHVAKEKNWDVTQDAYHDIVIKRPATVGYENAPTLMLQAHLDMVCEKDPGVEHDFLKDPLKLRIVDGFVHATGTTLGADNGIGVALILALLDTDDLKHPALEVLLTADEEMGMSGIKNFDGSSITAHHLINLDSKMDSLTVACAGGVRFSFTIPFCQKKSQKKNTYEIKVKGLHGGHSGAEIDKERGNAIKILGRILSDLRGTIELVSIDGNGKANVIPRNASAKINANDGDFLQEKINYWQKILSTEFSHSDHEIEVSVEQKDFVKDVLSPEAADQIINCIQLIQSGVIVRDASSGDVVYSNNLGVVSFRENEIFVECLSRSSSESLLDTEYIPRMHTIADALKIDGKTGEGFACWEYVENSKAREVCEKTYFEINGKYPEIISRHAGSECGYIMKKCPSLIDAVATGSRLFAMHTTDERLEIAAVGITFHYLSKILENFK